MSEEQLHSMDELRDELAKIVAKLGPLALASGEESMQEALEYLRGQIPPYPSDPPPGGYLKEAKPGARRYFFWAVQNDKLPGWKWVPKTKNKPAHPEGRYRQTGHLGQNITLAVSREEAAITGVLGMNAPYGPWVVGPDYPGEEFDGKRKYQARVHKNRWWQFQDVIDENIEATWMVFDQELEKRIVEAYEQETG